MGSAEKILPTVGGGNAGLWWVGVKDSDLRVFDVVMRTPVGTTYNSFLVVSSEHAVLFETVKKPFVNEWLRNIKQALGSASLTHLVVNHTEPDHSGGVSTALAEFPEVSLVATKTALSFLEKQGVQFSGHKTVPVSDRESLTIGSLTLEFHVLPFIHWPDTMITYIPQLKTAITCDFLGSHFCSSTFTLFVEAPHSVDYWNAFKYYFDVIFAPYRLYAKKAVDRIKELDLALVCCSHGPLLKDEILTEGIAKYCLWATPVELERRVVIAFVSAYGFTESLATEIAKGLEAVKVPCKVFDLLKTDFSVVWEEFSHSKGLLLGTPTIERDALGPVWNFATALKPPEHGDRVLGCFGSYGWSGEALANIQQRLKQVRGANVPLEPFAANFALSTSDSSSAVIWGAQFGQAVLGITTTVQPSRPVVLIPKSSDGKTHRWRCKICGEIFIGIEPPETCPVCGASKEEWVIEDLASVTSVASAAVVSTVPPAVPDVEDLESVREKAKEKLKGWCGVYKMCDGDYSKLCQGQSYGRRLGFGGIGSGQSFHNNFLALQAVKLRMSVISLHAEPDCSYNFFGRRLALPVMGAPATGVTSMANAITEEELCRATVFGCKSAGTIAWRGDSHTYNPYNPTTEMPCALAIKEASGFGVKISKPRELEAIRKTFELYEAMGAVAVGVDIDAPTSHLMTKFGRKVLRKSAEDLMQIVSMTRLPVIFKGVMNVTDARLAVDCHAAGIVVSNHGGRVVDCTPGTAEVLPKIVQAVGGRTKIFVDGGVRTGYDVMKMLALGAEAVLVGRDILRAAIGGGAKGVELQMQQYCADLKRAMTMCSVNRLSEINAACIRSDP